MKKKIRVGLDFDGVVAYNPFRIIRAPIALYKKKILGIEKLKFWVPKHRWQQIYWIIVHESSFFPAKGTTLLKHLAKRNDIEFYLITARFRFLSPSLYRWLDRFHMRHIFTGVYRNMENKQPHEHKLAVVKKLQLDYYVEDNWDIIQYLQGKTKTKLFWIYNVTDRRKDYQYKFPYLEKALEEIYKH